MKAAGVEKSSPLPMDHDDDGAGQDWPREVESWLSFDHEDSEREDDDGPLDEVIMGVSNMTLDHADDGDQPLIHHGSSSGLETRYPRLVPQPGSGVMPWDELSGSAAAGVQRQHESQRFLWSPTGKYESSYRIKYGNAFTDHRATTNGVNNRRNYDGPINYTYAYTETPAARSYCRCIMERCDTCTEQMIDHISQLGSHDKEYLYNSVYVHFRELARSGRGVISLKECYNRAPCERREYLLCLLLDDCEDLSTDRFGNYLVQHVADSEMIVPRIVRALRGKFVSLSKDKFGSNVVEKCLKNSSTCSPIIGEFTADESVLIQLAMRPFANYVIRTALAKSRGDAHYDLVSILKRYDNEFETSPYGGKKLLKELRSSPLYKMLKFCQHASVRKGKPLHDK